MHHFTLELCGLLHCTQPAHHKYQSCMLWTTTDTITVVSTWTTCQKRPNMEPFLVLQNLDASGHRERTLSETVRMDPLNKTSHSSSISKPRPGMWQRGQSPISHRVCFSTPLACCGICHQSREVNLSELKNSSTAKKLPVLMVEKGNMAAQ